MFFTQTAGHWWRTRVSPRVGRPVSRVDILKIIGQEMMMLSRNMIIMVKKCSCIDCCHTFWRFGPFRVFSQCEEARTVLLRRWLPEVYNIETTYTIIITILILILTMMILIHLEFIKNPGRNDIRETEESLVLPCAQVVTCFTILVAILRVSLWFFNRKRGESLRQVERFFLCVRAIMSIHLRWPDHQNSLSLFEHFWAKQSFWT